MNSTASRNRQLQFVLTPESLQVFSTRLILSPKQSLCKPYLKAQDLLFIFLISLEHNKNK